MYRAEQDLCDAFRLDSPISEQAKIPQGIRARPLLAESSLRFQQKDGLGGLVAIPGREVDFDRSGANAKIIGIERGGE